MISILHGHTLNRTLSPEYTSWLAMKQRCSNPRNPNYKNYGAKGITYDKRWKNFLHFLADMGSRPRGKVLGRKNHSANYSKDNCNWEWKGGK